MSNGVDAVWYAELDLKSPDPDPTPPCGDASSKSRLEERESSPWGMKLDKGTVLRTGDDTDEDIAPALLAKRRGNGFGLYHRSFTMS